MWKIFMIILLISVHSQAEELNPWFGGTINKTHTENYRGLYQAQTRFDSKGELFEIQSRAGIIYKTGIKGLELGGGAFFSLDPKEVKEFRPWQQIVYSRELTSIFSFKVRFRQEQRFYTQVGEYADRTRVRGVVNLKVNKYQTYLAQEFFWGWNEAKESDFKKGINQERTQIGVKIPVAKNIIWDPSLFRITKRGFQENTTEIIVFTGIHFNF